MAQVIRPLGVALAGLKEVEQALVLGVEDAAQAGRLDQLEGLEGVGGVIGAEAAKLRLTTLHFAGGEQFESDGAGLCHALDLVAVEQARGAVEADVDVGVAGGQGGAVLPHRSGGGARVRDRHLEQGGDATRRRRPRLRGEVAPFGKRGGAAVEVDVDGTGQDQHALGVDGAIGRDGLAGRHDGLDPAVLDQHRAHFGGRGRGRHQPPVDDRQVSHVSQPAEGSGGWPRGAAPRDRPRPRGRTPRAPPRG